MQPVLTLDGLAVLEAIEARGSFAAAAASLNRVPSAVSYTVQKLEQDLGVTLFQKQGRKAELTAAGRLLVEQGRSLLLAAEQLAARTRQEASGWETRLRIAVDHVIPMTLILPILQQLAALNEQLQLTLLSEVLGGTWEALLDDRADLVIGGVDVIPGHRGIRAQSWQHLSWDMVAASDHPLAAASEPVSEAQLADYPRVVIRDTARRQAALSRGLIAHNKVIYVPDFDTKIAAHCAGLGVGTAPRFRIKQVVQQGRLKVIPLQQPLPRSEIFLGWKSSNRGKARRWLVEQLLALPALD